MGPSVMTEEPPSPMRADVGVPGWYSGQAWPEANRAFPSFAKEVNTQAN